MNSTMTQVYDSCLVITRGNNIQLPNMMFLDEEGKLEYRKFFNVHVLREENLEDILNRTPPYSIIICDASISKDEIVSPTVNGTEVFLVPHNISSKLFVLNVKSLLCEQSNCTTYPNNTTSLKNNRFEYERYYSLFNSLKPKQVTSFSTVTLGGIILIACLAVHKKYYSK